MIIGLNAGHTLSGAGTGAVGVVKETDKNRQVLKRLTEMLKEHKHTVINCTVDKSSNDLSEACKLANKQKLDIFLSIHLNAFSNATANGVETYHYASSPVGKTYATKIQTELVSRVKWYNRGIKTANFYVLKNTNAPAVLVELGFCTNKKDMGLWNTENICKSLFKSLTGQEYKTTTVTPKPPVTDSNKLYRVQVGAYSVKANAENLAKELKAKGYSAIIV